MFLAYTGDQRSWQERTRAALTQVHPPLLRVQEELGEDSSHPRGPPKLEHREGETEKNSEQEKGEEASGNWPL